MVCPWKTGDCPGEQECAPAVLMQKKQGAPAPQCPIVGGITTLGLFNAWLLLHIPMGEEREKSPDEMTDEEARAFAFKKIGIPYPPPPQESKQ